MSEMYVLCVRIPPNLDNWARWPISSSADCSQRRKKTTVTRHFYTVQCFTQRKIRNKPSSNPFKLQAPSDPEVFSRSLAAAAAEALTMGRFGFLMPSSTSLSRQLWAYSRRSSSASAQKKIRNQAATARATSPYPIGSLLRNSVSSNLIGKNWRKSRQNCFASSMLPMLLAYDGITNLKGNKQVLHIHTSTACLLSTICSDGSLQNTKTPHKKTVGKKRKHCTYCTSNDVLSILAMLHFGGKGDYELNAAGTGQSPESCRKQMFASNSFNAVVGLASSASLSNAMGTGRGILGGGG